MAATRQRVLELAERRREVMEAAESAPAGRGFAAALSTEGLSIIAELKRRSPSKGDLNRDLDPAEQATSYAAGGAAALSVLTEPQFFEGSPEDLSVAKKAVELPVLRKDFIIDPLQVWESRAMGADALLLIASILEVPELATLHGQALAAGIAPLVEVHNEEEVKRAVAAGAAMIGVNNRDLETFQVDLTTAERLAPMLGEVPVKIAESGIFFPEDADRMRAVGYQAVLVGEALALSDDPAALIGQLRR